MALNYGPIPPPGGGARGRGPIPPGEHPHDADIDEVLAAGPPAWKDLPIPTGRTAARRVNGTLRGGEAFTAKHVVDVVNRRIRHRELTDRVRATARDSGRRAILYAI